MNPSFLMLLLLFNSSVMALGADRIGFYDAVPAAVEPALPHSFVQLLDCSLDPHKPADSEPESVPPAEQQYHNCVPEYELHVSSSEKFESSFCETMVLHLVTQHQGKARPDSQTAKFPGSPSLRRLNIMLQV